MGSLLPPKTAVCLWTALLYQLNTQIFLCSVHGIPLALPPSLRVKATWYLTLSPVMSRLKNSRASHHFCCDMVSCPFTVHSTLLSAPSRFGQGEVFPQTHRDSLQHPQISPSYTDLKF